MKVHRSTAVILVLCFFMGGLLLYAQSNDPIPLPTPVDAESGNLLPLPEPPKTDNNSDDPIDPFALAVPIDNADSFIRPVFRVNHALTNYRLIYFAASSERVGLGIIPSDELLRQSGAHLATTWDEVMAADTQNPIQGLIIDHSVKNLVDPAWVQNAYRRGVVIAAFNFGWPDLPQMLGILHCEQPRESHEADSANFFISSAFLALSANPADLQLVESAIFEQCIGDDDDAFDVFLDHISDQPLFITEKAGGLNLDSRAEFDQFMHFLNSQLNDIETARQEFGLYGGGR